MTGARMMLFFLIAAALAGTSASAGGLAHSPGSTSTATGSGDSKHLSQAVEPAAGVWLYRDSGPRGTLEHTISATASGFDIVTVATYSGSEPVPLVNTWSTLSTNECSVPAGTTIGRFQFLGLDRQGKRTYQGQLLESKVSGRSCQLLGLQGTYYAWLNEYADSSQVPALPKGPYNELRLYKADQWHPERPGSVSWVHLVRKAGTPVPTVPGGYDMAGWSANASRWYQQYGKQLTFYCPPPPNSAYPIWGTDVYTADSSVCTAAVHAGLIPLHGAGGTVMIQIAGGRASYSGSTRNGINSGNWGSFHTSFVFGNATPAEPAEPATLGAADTVPPKVKALPAVGKAGTKIKLRYKASDNSGKTSDSISVYQGRKKIWVWSSKLEATKPSVTYYTLWPSRVALRGKSLTFCVASTDEAGNVSEGSCARITLR